MSNCLYYGNFVDSVQLNNDLLESVLSTKNEKGNGLLGDILVSDASTIIDANMMIDTVHVIPDLTLSNNLSNNNSPSSHYDLDSVYAQNSTYKKLNERRVENIKKIIIAELNINSI